MTKISTIVPAHNEGENLIILVNELLEVYQQNKYSGNIIIAANGCNDNTPQLLEDITRKNENIIGLNLSKANKSLAISEALRYVFSPYIALIDADLQYDSQDIKKLTEKLKEGYDIVSAKRIKRADPISRKIVPYIGHLIFNSIYNTDVQDINSGLKVMKKDFLDIINFCEYSEKVSGLHKFLVPLAIWHQLRIAEVEVKHFPREYGKSHIKPIKTPYKILEDLLILKKIMKIKKI